MQFDQKDPGKSGSDKFRSEGKVSCEQQSSDRELIEMKAALERSNQENARILDSISDGYFVLDHEWRFTFVNKRGFEILRGMRNFSGEGLLGKTLWEGLPEILGSDLEDRFRKVMREGVAAEFETAFEPLGAWFNIRVHPSPDGLFIFLLDISGRKRTELERGLAEEAKRDSEQRFGATFNQVAVGMAIASLDGRIEQVNERFAEILGRTPDELLGYTFFELTHADDLDRTRKQVERVLAGEGTGYVYEKRYVRPDSTVVWSLTSVSVLRDSMGRPDRFVGVIEDITDRKRAEDAAKEAVQRLQLALAAGHLGDWSWDIETDELTLGEKAAEIFGLNATTPAITWRELSGRIHAEDREAVHRTVNAALAGKSDYEMEYRVNIEGGCRWIASRGRGIYRRDGSVAGMTGVVLDISERKAAEQAHSRLAAVVESSDDAIISMELDARITTWNKGAELMFGYSAEEVVGRYINLLIPGDREDEEPEILQRLVRGERVEHYETLRMRKDGTILNVSLTVSPVYDGTGRIVGVSKISRDITQQKKAEAALRRSEEELRSLADSISQLAWMARPDGSVFWYNRRWYEYTGSTPEEMEGWGWERVHDPQVLHTAITLWKNSIETGVPFEMEFPLRGKDGVFRWFLTRANPMRDADGRVVRWFGTNTDVTEFREMQQALQEESRVLEILNESGKAIASQLDLNNIVQIVTDSATRLVGAQFGAFFHNVLNEEGESLMLYTLSGAPREAFDKFGHPRSTPLFGPTFRGEAPVRIADVLKDPRYGQMPPHYGMPEGHLPVRSYLAVPVLSRTGEVIGGLFFGHSEPGIFTQRAERLVVGIAAQAAVAVDNARLYDAAQKEIHRRKTVEVELRAAQEQLRSRAFDLEIQVQERTAKLQETIGELEGFSYSVSHDMRSPLRAMQGYADALLDEYYSKFDATGQDYLNRIKRAAIRMDMLIQDVLTYSRVAQGEIVLKPVDVEGVVRDVIDSYPPLQEPAARISVAGPIPNVLGHEAYLTQVVSNILTNAVKFVQRGTLPEVEVRGEVEGQQLRLSFRDNGIGIAPEHRHRIFQIFGRVYSEKEYQGSGIGLAIAKKAVERMGGRIDVESEAGKGSTFIVTLKLA